MCHQVLKERRRNRLKRVMLATPSSVTLNQKDFRDRVELGQQRDGFESNPIQEENVTRYRTSSQELQDMVTF